MRPKPWKLLGQAQQRIRAMEHLLPSVPKEASSPASSETVPPVLTVAAFRSVLNRGSESEDLKKQTPRLRQPPSCCWGEGGERDRWGVCPDAHVHTALFKTDNQQGPSVQHRRLWLWYVAAWTGGRFRWERVHMGFPGSSDSKESAWNAGDLGSIPGVTYMCFYIYLSIFIYRYIFIFYKLFI